MSQIERERRLLRRALGLRSEQHYFDSAELLRNILYEYYPSHTDTEPFRDFLLTPVVRKTLGKGTSLAESDIGSKVDFLEGEISTLDNRMKRVENTLGIGKEPTKADLIYEAHKKELEREHFGEIVAIDIDLGEIVGIGKTIIEAYKQAKQKSSKGEFSYKRVGYSSVYKLV